MFDKTVTFQLSDDNSPDIIAMEVRHISGKRWMTREDKETLSKAADIIEELINYKKSWDRCGTALVNAFGFGYEILINGKEASVTTKKGE